MSLSSPGSFISSAYTGPLKELPVEDGEKESEGKGREGKERDGD
jgi:hypothetical protein